MQRFDIGNHHFPALARTALAEALVKTCPAEHAARSSTARAAARPSTSRSRPRGTPRQRRKIVSILKGYHGHTGLAVASGDDRFSQAVPVRPAGRVRAGAVQRPGRDGGGAARPATSRPCCMETIPATYGFPLPEPGYLKGVKRLCERYGALYIADEVQTGLMRTGEMWGITKAGIEPDIMVDRQGHHRRHVPDRLRGRLGGVLPAWLKEDGFGHISTGGGAELGCIVGAEGAGDLRPAGDALDGALHRRPVRPRPAGDPGAAIPTGSSASARTAS